MSHSALRPRRSPARTRGETEQHSSHSRSGAMDQATLRHCLARAEARAAQGELHLAEQRRIVAEFERNGYRGAQSRRLLDSLEQLYATRLAEVERIRRELTGVANCD